MNAIELQGLSKTFTKGKRQVVAVRDVSLKVGEGELYGLLGVNGAGKTTIIRMLCGITPVTSGEAYIFGESVRKDIDGIKKIIAVSPQETSVAPNLTARENLKFFAEIYGKGKQSAVYADEMLRRFGLEEVADRRAKTLSGGWQRRLSIALALVSEPKLLFLDEPTLGLDVLARRELWRLIEQLKGKCTVILTTHYLEEAEQLCDRVAILSKGELLAAGTPDELKSSVGENSFEDAFIKIVEGTK